MGIFDQKYPWCEAAFGGAKRGRTWSRLGGYFFNDVRQLTAPSVCVQAWQSSSEILKTAMHNPCTTYAQSMHGAFCQISRNFEGKLTRQSAHALPVEEAATC